MASAHDAVGFPRSTAADLVLVAWVDGDRAGTGWSTARRAKVGRSTW